jgi:hypothetical protein
VGRDRGGPAGFHIALGRKDIGLVEVVAAAGGVSPATLPAPKAVFDRDLADPELERRPTGAP